jgi:competence protein ComEC
MDEALDERHSGLRAGKIAKFSGSVLEAPRQWGRSLVFFVSASHVDDRELDQPVLVLVRWSGGEDIVAPGESWTFTGRFGLGERAAYPGGFSQDFWLWTQRAQGVVSLNRFSEVSYQGPPAGWGPRALAARLRQRMLARLESIEHLTARSLIAGVVFGDTQALPKDVQEQFRRTGTSHLLAASGMNVALLVGLIVTLARLLGYGPWRVAPGLIPLAIGYAFLAGCAPSITRAAAAAVMGLLAACWGRTSGAWNSLCLSVWVLLLWEPRQIYDPGFQLSVAAVIGLIAGPSLDEGAPGWKKSSLMTISACMLTLPIMWTMFGELSLTLLPANLILGPLVECLFPLGLLLTLLPLPPLCWVTEHLARLSLWLVKEISWLADPVPLSEPGAGSLALLALAIMLWIGTDSKARWWAIPLATLALCSGQWAGLRPTAAPGELVVRQVGLRKPYYWLSSHREELLVLAEGWQEQRARSMLLDMGCLREPEIKVLKAGQSFTVRWGAFGWGKVHPLLPKAPYVEVRTTGCTYQAHEWRP